MPQNASPADSPDELDVSVVIGASASEASLQECLAALEPQRRRTQVIVVEPRASSQPLRDRFAWVEFLECPGALVPEMWRDGIDRARGRIVALTISPMLPAHDWIDSIVRAHERHDVVGGAIDPGHRLRLGDWAEYFCRYTRHMLPFEPHEAEDVAGDNASYKRALLIQHREHLREGFWEPIVHPVLRRGGVQLWHTPAMLVRFGRSSGLLAFARQRSRHGRKYPRQRGVEFSRGRHAAGIIGSPAVPFLMTLRVLRNVFRKKRHRGRALAVLPLVFALNAVWAVAEARGHLDLAAGR